MDDHEHKDENYFDPWSIFSPTERESIENIEDEDHLFERLNEQREAALERLWATFQGAAASLAQLYKVSRSIVGKNEHEYERPSCDCCERCLYRANTHDRWLPFQGAANKVTLLYRDGSEGLRAGIELGYRAGYQRRNRDITNWIKKKKRTIRREDILLNLSGRSPPRRKSTEPRMNSLSQSPKPATPENEVLTLSDGKEFDIHAFVDGRNPFTEGRKRHNENNFMESPHKRSRFS